MPGCPRKRTINIQQGMEQESTPSVSMDAAAAMEEQELEGDVFPKVEKHGSVSLKFIIKPEAAMTHTVEVPRPSMLRCRRAHSCEGRRTRP